MATTYYFLPTRNLFGEDSVQEAGTLMQSLGGKKALIVTDSFLAASGMAASIQEILQKRLAYIPRHHLPGRRFFPRLRKGYRSGCFQRRKYPRL